MGPVRSSIFCAHPVRRRGMSFAVNSFETRLALAHLIARLLAGCAMTDEPTALPYSQSRRTASANRG